MTTLESKICKVKEKHSKENQDGELLNKIHLNVFQLKTAVKCWAGFMHGGGMDCFVLWQKDPGINRLEYISLDLSITSSPCSYVCSEPVFKSHQNTGRFKHRYMELLGEHAWECDIYRSWHNPGYGHKCLSGIMHAFRS